MNVQKLNVTAVGTFTAVSPLAVAVMDADTNEDGAVLLPRVGGKKGQVYYPATGFLGTLRRALRNEIRDAVITATGNEKPWDVETFFLLTVGGLGFDPGNDVRLDMADRRRLNPLESLFGSVRMRAHLGAGNLYMTSEIKDDLPIQGGVRTNDFARDPEELAYLNDEDVERLRHRLQYSSEKTETNTNVKSGKGKMSALKKKLEKAVADGNEAQEKEILAIMDEELKHLEIAKAGQAELKKQGLNAIQMPWKGYEYFPVGTQFSHRFSVFSMTPTELGFLLAAFRRFAALPRLGGHWHHDCGWVSAEWTLRTQDGNLGKITVSFDDGFKVTGEALESALKIFDDMVKDGFSTCDFIDRESEGLEGGDTRKKRMTKQA